MSETKWTPGPWFVVNCGTKDEPMMSVKAARIAGESPRHEVAICATGDSPQAMENANARLIAAAPDLYEALKAIVGIAGNSFIQTRHGGQVIAAARAALAKAAR
jgi:CTP:molybdopterin cytidylyltransferase MocA